MKLYQAIAGIIAGIMMYLTQAVSISLIILVVFMVIDYATGMYAAKREGTISSRVGADGIVKKVCILLLVFMCTLVDYLLITEITFIDMSALGFQGAISFVTCCWYIGNELISILENLGRIGVPIPTFVKKTFAKFKDVIEPSKE